MSIEDRLIAGIDNNRNREQLSLLMKRAHEKACEVLSDPDYVINEADFEGVYGTENVQRDVEEAERLARIFEVRQTESERTTKKISEVLEAIIIMNAEMNEWLGEADTLKTARYDDFKNKTDMLVEWHSPEDGSRILALAVDITFGTSSVDKKMMSIKSEIDTGTLGTIRYFKDARDEFIGTRNNVPRVIIGVSKEMIEDLAALWLRKDNKALAVHPIQRLLIEEIKIQLEAMLLYAQSKGARNVENAYAQALALIKPLAAKKIGIRLGDAATDPVAQSISSTARRVFT